MSVLYRTIEIKNIEQQIHSDGADFLIRFVHVLLIQYLFQQSWHTLCASLLSASWTAQKDLGYKDMRAMREQLKAVEILKKASDKLQRNNRIRAGIRRNMSIAKPPYRVSSIRRPVLFIFQTNRCVSRCGSTSVPEHHPQCGRPAASLEEYGARGVLSNSQ